MSLTDLTPVVDALLRPCGRRLAGQGYTAAMVTVAGTAACLAVSALVAVSGAHRFTILLLVPAQGLRLAALRLQALLVNEHGKGSLTARLLDEVSRPVSEVALFWPLSFAEGLDGSLVTVCCLLTVLTEFAGLAVTAIGVERRQDGPLDAPTRGLTLATVCLFLGLGVQPGWWTWVWFQVLPLLQGWTILRRLQGGLRQVNGVGSPAEKQG
jgi:CDP-diacylglycerol--glycerol-3-phosphate 3-phosphatidyltransferase